MIKKLLIFSFLLASFSFGQTTINGVKVTLANVPPSATLSSCISASGSGTTYTCPLAITSYTSVTNILITWIPDMNGAGGATTLNINSLGPKSIKAVDGTTNPTSTDIIANQPKLLIYNGTVFLMAAASTSSGDPTIIKNNQVNTGTSGFTLDATAAPAGAIKVTTPTPGDNSTKAASTAFVQNAVSTIAGGNYSQSFTSQTSVVLTHNLGSTDVIVSCYDNGSPRQFIEFDTLKITDSNNVTVTFTVSQSGRCTVLKSGGGGGGGSSLCSGVNVVTFSATPNFDLSLGCIQEITLTAPITSFTVSNPTSSATYTFIFKQDTFGGWTVSGPPASFHAFFTIGTTANKFNVQKFDYDGTVYVAASPGVINQ